MESDKGLQVVLLSQEHAKVVNGGLAVEVVIAGEKEIPGQDPEPGKVVASVHGIGDGDEFMVAFDLYDKDEENEGEGAEVNDPPEPKDEDPG